MAETALPCAPKSTVELHTTVRRFQLQRSTMLGSTREIAMDADTAEAVDTLRADIQQVDVSLRSELRELGSSMGTEMRDLRTEMQEFRTEMRDLRTEMHDLRTEMHEVNDETKRHMDVVAESLRDDIRIIVEGVVALSAKVDSLAR